MNKLTWTFQILLALVFGLFGAQKVVMPIPDLIEFGMWWIEDFPAWQVRVIGALEVLGAVGLVAPYGIKALPRMIVPLAAGGLALTMIGAIATHVQRQDPTPSIVITSVLFVLSVVVAVRRFKEARAES
ncbi:MAG: DoxX family protein [Proteobacteria bacterium]|nr:DoxX family protein [Pseudomonadota bacterium]